MFRRVVTAALIALSFACGESKVTDLHDIRGTWTLQTVNGAPLPYTTSGSGSNKTELVANTLTLYEGSTYSEMTQVRTTVNGQATTSTTTRDASYAIVMGGLVFNNNEGLPARNATLSGHTLTFTEAGFTRVFAK